MRKWAICLLLSAIALPATAAKSVSVEQLEQLLAQNQGKSDAHVAQQLADLELTERVSPVRMARWEAKFSGSKTRAALMRVADAAAFLNPPHADMVPIAPPDGDTQERMMELAVDYVKTTMTRLPNFFAVRETTHFEDVPSQEQMMAGGSLPSGWRMRPLGLSMGRTEAKLLRETGTYSTTVAYRDGYEVHGTAGAKQNQANQAPPGLTTIGEFGPVLSVVTGDASRAQVTWGYWEQGTGDPMAVLHYTVSEDQSNYAVGIPNGTKVDTIYPAYHGEFAIDPATGSILRITVVADLMGPYQAMQTAILVEYAPVAIGTRTYICPVHGVAFSKVPVGGTTQQPQSGTITVQTQMNDVTFTHYHLFGSESRILTGDKGQSAGSAAAGTADNGAPAAPASDANPNQTAPATTPAEQPAPTTNQH